MSESIQPGNVIPKKRLLVIIPEDAEVFYSVSQVNPPGRFYILNLDNIPVDKQRIIPELPALRLNGMPIYKAKRYTSGL
jgi:hypothetical protein